MEELNKFKIDDLIKEIKTRLLEKSSTAIDDLQKIFEAMDSRPNHMLDVDDFRWGFIDHGVQLSKEEAASVQESFDSDGSGLVDFEKFLTAIRQ